MNRLSEAELDELIGFDERERAADRPRGPMTEEQQERHAAMLLGIEPFAAGCGGNTYVWAGFSDEEETVLGGHCACGCGGDFTLVLPTLEYRAFVSLRDAGKAAA